MRVISVTLGAAATPITTKNIYSPFVTIQNNSAAAVYIGDNRVTGATNGIFLPPTTATGSGSYTIQRADNRILLNQYYLFGTAGSVIVVHYE